MNPALLASYSTAHGLEYGWRPRAVTWLLDITDPANPVFVPHGEREVVPYVRRSGPVAAPRPGCDSLEYLTGRHQQPWRDMQAAAIAGSAALSSREVVAAVTGLEPPAKAKGTDLVALRSHGMLLHENPNLRGFWRDHVRAGLNSGRRGLCLCCGEAGPLARLIPAYLPPAVFNQQGSGDLALYPTTRERGTGSASTCVGCACALGAALPALAGDQEHRHRTREGDLLLWWDPDGGPAYPLGPLLDAPDQDALAAVPLQGRVCAMLLRAYNGRMALIWHLTEPTRTVHERIIAWHRAAEVHDTFLGRTRVLAISAMHAQLGLWNDARGTYQPPRTSPPESDLWIAALSGNRPARHAHAALMAIRRDARVSMGRTALLQLGGDASTGFVSASPAMPAPVRC